MPESMSSSIRIGVVGCGAMGTGIAQLAAMHGHPVLIVDVQPEFAATGKQRIERYLQRMVEKGNLTAGQAAATLKRIDIGADLPSLAGAGLIIEAAPEALAVKQQIFRELDLFCPETTLLATNTSSLSVTALGGVTTMPGRVLGMHFFNPAPLMALVEIVQGEGTSAAAIAQAVTLVQQWGKTPVVVRDTPGFIVNRVARAFYLEAMRLLEEGVADVPTIDRILQEGSGFPMGPFRLMDLLGLDINLAVNESIFESFYYEPRFRPSPLQRRMVAAGKLGRKSGAGFYTYGEGG